MRNAIMSLAAIGALTIGACQTTGGMNDTTRNAAIGGAIGAAAGAVIAGEGDRTEGALIGGAIGAAAGAAYGCSKNQTCPWSAKNPNQTGLMYDSKAQRNFFVDKTTGYTYWESGELRSTS